jgi:hypothetical protein
MKRTLLVLAASVALTMGANAQQSKDRWILITHTAAHHEPVYVDGETIEYSPNPDAPERSYIKFWMKMIHASGSVRLSRIELNRSTRQYRKLSEVLRSASGETHSSDTATGWQTPSPDSIIEEIYEQFELANAPSPKGNRL